ncbi:endonuclease/exonuclease/phosphatase family protein [Carboxylicivirga sediminis]|uniref:Endonuclease/exonuclease/phosphatase family protein n=1 Tax=Carboxylicivirga sediminis TaxID=2006564 RepID=A0A941FAL2_9BACT|nr:endonuclease/exonuclease/phosphatase family protein [Carboxylicivirga sediminis]MBR8537635.1 endonuclease/exonuclease/phosphatase family protein [Carboxylicivirga sediminis]
MLTIKHSVVFMVLLVLVSGCNIGKRADGRHDQQAVIGFYNLENLFDTIDASGVNDEEFTPQSVKQWTSARYAAKLNNMAEVIASLGDTIGKGGPAIMGLCEVENVDVVNDLIANKHLVDLGYQVVHQESPDKRGIDVALLYRPELFQVENVTARPLYIYDQVDGERIYTRDQLLVSGLLLGEKVHVVVNHWPSRYGGEERSRPSRRAAAELSRAIVDSLQAIDNAANVILMGDLNDDPDNISVKEVLKAVKAAELNEAKDLYNPYADMHIEGVGTLCYRGFWNMFDQIVLTQGMMEAEKGLSFEKAYIYNHDRLKVADGKYKGYPYRTYVGKRYDGGYSDHFPVYIVLNKY